MAALNWTEEDLARLPKGDPGKVALAGRLRLETTMTLKWIARRLQMGRWTYVTNLLNGERVRGAEPANPNQQLLLYK